MQTARLPVAVWACVLLLATTVVCYKDVFRDVQNVKKDPNVFDPAQHDPKTIDRPTSNFRWMKRAMKVKPDQWKTMESGVQYYDVVIGKGRPAKTEDIVKINYKMYTEKNNDGNGDIDEHVYSQPSNDDIMEFTLGQNDFIKGFDHGVRGMRVGGKRKVRIPSLLAYGEYGAFGTPIKNGTNVVYFYMLRDIDDDLSVDEEWVDDTKADYEAALAKVEEAKRAQVNADQAAELSQEKLDQKIKEEQDASDEKQKAEL